jgi:hypothetical protein
MELFTLFTAIATIEENDEKVRLRSYFTEEPLAPYPHPAPRHLP